MRRNFAWVTIVCSRRAEAYVGRNPLSFVHPPVRGDYTRKRSVEQYLLPIGLAVTMFDGFTRQDFKVVLGKSSGVVMRGARAVGSIRSIRLDD